MTNAKQVASEWLGRHPDAKVYPAYIRNNKFSTAEDPHNGFDLDDKVWSAPADTTIPMARCSSEFAVVDVDDVELADTFGITKDILQDAGGLIVDTPSGGFHAIFAGEKVVGERRLINRTTGFDLLTGEHGFYIPGSYRPAFGKKCEGTYTITEDQDELARLPKWIRDLADESTTENKETSRHNTIMVRARANYMRGLFGEDNFQQINRSLLVEYRKAEPNRPWTYETRSIVKWYEKKLDENKVDVPEGAVFSLGKMTRYGQQILLGDEIVDILSSRPLQVYQWPYKSGASYKEYLEFYHKTIEIRLPDKTLITPSNRSEYLALRPEALIVEPDISIGAPNESTLFFGQTNQGKSFVVLYAVRESKLNCLYIATEQIDEIAERAELMGLDNVWIHSQPGQTDINGLVELCETENIQIIVTDVLAPMMGNENASDEFHRVMDMLAPLTDGRISVLVHHEGKSQEAGPRGTSRIMDMVNRAYRISSSFDNGTSTVTIKPKKVKGYKGSKGGILEITRHEDGVDIIVGESDSGIQIARKDLYADFCKRFTEEFGDEPQYKNSIYPLVYKLRGGEKTACRELVEIWIEAGRLERVSDSRSGKYKPTKTNSSGFHDSTSVKST